jgi:hypothetical protein
MGQLTVERSEGTASFRAAASRVGIKQERWEKRGHQIKTIGSELTTVVAMAKQPIPTAAERM